MESRKFSDLPPFKNCAIFFGEINDYIWFDSEFYYGLGCPKHLPRTCPILTLVDGRRIGSFESLERYKQEFSDFKPDLLLLHSLLTKKEEEKILSRFSLPDSRIFYFQGDELYQ